MIIFQGDGDDTATNCVKFYCASSGTWHEPPSCNSWGSWRTHNCESGKRICGIKTRVEKKQGDGKDDTALNNIDLKCCLIG